MDDLEKAISDILFRHKAVSTELMRLTDGALCEANLRQAADCVRVLEYLEKTGDALEATRKPKRDPITGRMMMKG
jgi:hypothetical protein